MEEKTSLEKISESFRERATVKSVYGEPIEAHGRTIIPVAKLAYGIGGGHGQGHSPGRAGRIGGHEHQGEGDGAGGGLMVSPHGFLEVSDGSARFVPFFAPKKILVAALLGAFIGFVVGGRRAKKSCKAKLLKRSE